MDWLASRPLAGLTLIFTLILPALSPARAQEIEDPRDRRIAELERAVADLRGQVRLLQDERSLPGEPDDLEQLSELDRQIRDFIDSGRASPNHWTGRFTVGGYGELHWNFGEGSATDQFDIHRFVLAIGHEFSEFLRLDSEIEIEHAYVSDDSGGEVVIEQLHVDLLLSDAVNLRLGRILTPIGIVNAKHEPNSFNGVERPLFAKVIVPSTWSADGLGFFGSLTEIAKYELYVVAGMDGTGFDAVDGIRGGRIKERPGLNQPSLTGRVDIFPFATAEVTGGQVLRFGLSGWYGGLDNGNKGKDPDVDARLWIAAADLEYSLDIFDFRGEAAFEWIDGARELGGGTANTVFGWYLEAAAHVLPDELRSGVLRNGDLVVFIRYEHADTQFRLPRGVLENPAGDRSEWVFGLTLFLRPNAVFKVDYRIRSDQSGDLDSLFNVGFGWQF